MNAGNSIRTLANVDLGLRHSTRPIYDTDRWFSLLHSLYGVPDLPFLIRFGVVTRLLAEGHSASISGMRKFAMCTFPTTRDFVESGCSEIVDKLSDFLSIFTDSL
jgi:hypothetical protein